MSSAAFPAAVLVFPEGQWWWASLASGVGAPVIIRSQVKFVGRKGVSKDFGPEVLYRKLRTFVDGKIERQTSSTDSAWIINDVGPKISQIPAVRLLARIEGYFKLLERSSETSHGSQLTYLRKMFSEAAKSDSETVHEAVAFQLLCYGHRELLEGLLAEADAISRVNGSRVSSRSSDANINDRLNLSEKSSAEGNLD
ncbi:hypothetical protein AB0M80_43845 [Amycolatopsis sp. NPDC051045]|uniref:hypothetical protein n=1 Tax=Amycolatopsis sp. NPDC051045 TaxID=3156922 RepID=UPI003421FE45